MVYEMTNFTFKKNPNTILVLVVTITLTFSLTNCRGFLKECQRRISGRWYRKPKKNYLTWFLGTIL